MSRDTTVIRLRQPDAIDDPLSEVAREGARRMLAQVLIAEADAFVALWKDVKLPDGRDRVVRHGHGPERAIQTVYALNDLSYALELASDAGIRIRGAELIGTVLQEAIDAGSGDNYFPVIAKHIDSR